MKNLIAIVLVLISNLAFAQESTQEEVFSFEVEITGFRTNDGNIAIQIFDKDKNVLKAIYSEIIDSTCTAVFENLQKGSYAIRYYHDENSDKEFGTNFMGIPNEGYGYSNNAKGYFGEPDFKDWLFLLEENKSLNLEISYLF